MSEDNNVLTLMKIAEDNPEVTDFFKELAHDSDWTAQRIAKATGLSARTIRHHFKMGWLDGQMCTDSTGVEWWQTDSIRVIDWAIERLPKLLRIKKNEESNG